jgi:hypothetical protein
MPVNIKIMKHRDHTQPMPDDTHELWPSLVMLLLGTIFTMACLKSIIPHLDKQHSSPAQHRRTAL